MKLLFDTFPLLVFFAAFKLYDIYVATAAAIVATVIQMLAFWWQRRRLETLHWVTLAALILFGGLTIILQDERFLKWKPSVVNWVFSGIIFAMLLGKKTALEYVMGTQLDLPKPVWRNLNLAWGVFFLCLGGLNLYVAFYYNLSADAESRTEFWVNFKVFGLLGLSVLFTLLQIPFLARYVKREDD